MSKIACSEMKMPFIIKFEHKDSPVCFLSNEQTERLAMFRAFAELFFSLGDDDSRAERALDDVREMKVEQMKEFKFNTDVYHYRSVLTFCSIREITYEQYGVLNELSDALALST